VNAYEVEAGMVFYRYLSAFGDASHDKTATQIHVTFTFPLCPNSGTIDVYSAAHTGGRRLSWPEHTVG